jgi:hypothetical protein
MSPTDEIRWINKLASKYGKKKLSKYHQWVLGGCKGPHPMRSKLLKRSDFVGPCPKTKVTLEEVVRLKKKVESLKKKVRKLEAKIIRAQQELR